MAKKKGLTILLDEDISAGLLIEFLDWKGYKVEVVTKGEQDHLIRARLARSPLPLFLTKDKGWLRAGVAPKHHGGIVVFDAGHLNELELTRLVNSFVAALESVKRLSGDLLDRRYLYAGGGIWEYAPDGSATKVWPRG